jgi:hypothetical protein
MTGPTPKTPDRNAVRRAAQDILIGARIIELRRLAERTARGELPVPDDDVPPGATEIAPFTWASGI